MTDLAPCGVARFSLRTLLCGEPVAKVNEQIVPYRPSANDTFDTSVTESGTPPQPKLTPRPGRYVGVNCHEGCSGGEKLIQNGMESEVRGDVSSAFTMVQPEANHFRHLGLVRKKVHPPDKRGFFNRSV